MGKRHIFFFIIGVACLFSCGKGHEKSIFKKAEWIVFTDSNKVGKYNIDTKEKSILTQLPGYCSEGITKMNDSLVSVSYRQGHFFFMYDTVLMLETQYSHPDFFDTKANLPDFSSIAYQYSTDTVYHYIVNVYTSELRKYRTDVHIEYYNYGPSNGYHIHHYFYDKNYDSIVIKHKYQNDPNIWSNDNTRFYSESNVVNGKRIITSKANMILQSSNKNDTIIKKMDKHWNYKFGEGPFQPSLDPSGQKVVYRDLSGQWSGWNGILANGIFELDIYTGYKTKIASGIYENPKYSSNGKFILLSSYNGELTPPFEFYLYNRKDKMIRKFLEANQCIWL